MLLLFDSIAASFFTSDFVYPARAVRNREFYVDKRDQHNLRLCSHLFVNCMVSPRCADDHERRRCGFSALELTPATQIILSDHSIRPFTNGSLRTRAERSLFVEPYRCSVSGGTAMSTIQGISPNKSIDSVGTLREDNFRLQLAVESANIGIYELKVKNGELLWDDRVRAQWGLPSGAPVDYDTFLKGIHPDDREATQAAVDRALDPKEDGRCRVEIRV